MAKSKKRKCPCPKGAKRRKGRCVRIRAVKALKCRRGKRRHKKA